MQTHLGSLVETAVNYTSGFALAWLTSMYVLPRFGFPVTQGQGFWITTIFTVISVVRSYACRRLFNYLQSRSTQ